MAYVAAKGGEEAIQQAEKLFHTLKGTLTHELVESIAQNMPYLLDRVMGEASLYAPQLAALALAQTGGDLYEATLLLRAYRSTQPRLAYAHTVTDADMLIVRRISAAFKDIPGGQMLGPTLDYSHRLLRIDVLDGVEEGMDTAVTPASAPAPAQYPYLTDWQRRQDLLPPLPEMEEVSPHDIPDLTRGPLLIPAPRAHRLQSLARAETGGVLTLGYANMRGYGGVHPTVNELRLAYTEVNITHPVTGAPFSLGRIRTSQCETVSTFAGTAEKPQLELGFCATLGWNEVKTIAGSMLDMAMDKPAPHPAHTEEFVLYHTETVEASGFCIHYKLPHYVTFNSSLDNMRQVMQASGWLREPDDEEEKLQPMESI
jgi:alpha-D-ribose 1-methylphosphonate 5-triphosphate synthase subunit PhnI